MTKLTLENFFRGINEGTIDPDFAPITEGIFLNEEVDAIDEYHVLDKIQTNPMESIKIDAKTLLSKGAVVNGDVVPKDIFKAIDKWLKFIDPSWAISSGTIQFDNTNSRKPTDNIYLKVYFDAGTKVHQYQSFVGFNYSFMGVRGVQRFKVFYEFKVIGRERLIYKDLMTKDTTPPSKKADDIIKWFEGDARKVAYELGFDDRRDPNIVNKEFFERLKERLPEEKIKVSAAQLRTLAEVCVAGCIQAKKTSQQILIDPSTAKIIKSPGKLTAWLRCLPNKGTLELVVPANVSEFSKDGEQWVAQYDVNRW